MGSLFKKLINKLKISTSESIASPIEPPIRNSIFSTDLTPNIQKYSLLQKANAKIFQKTPDDFKITTDEGVAMDSKDVKFAMDYNIDYVKAQFSINSTLMPPGQFGWYASQSFIGYQTCAMLAQHWLIDKACTMPARDAIRHGFDITIDDGTEIDVEVRDYIRKKDLTYGLNKNLLEFIRFGRVFGIRVALFEVESDDPDYYFKPFNIDGVKPGSYRGISQIDPYWITPELDTESLANPGSMHFYEPTWWRVNGNRVHRSHLVIMTTGEVSDILKPTYIYGGVPVPQKIYERIYAAERIANEAPMLALSKRTTVIGVDAAQALANQEAFEKRLSVWSALWNNYGVKVKDLEEEVQQFDTSLADLDEVIMTQYQIVAAAANVPATKLLGTQPKGFNSTGEHEEKSYHEELESIQEHDLTPLIERHHLLLIKSDVSLRFGIEPFSTSVSWKPTSSVPAKEQAEINEINARAGAALVAAGAIDGVDERNRIINDDTSGYTGIESMDIPYDEKIESDTEGD